MQLPLYTYDELSELAFTEVMALQHVGRSWNSQTLQNIYYEKEELTN